MSYLNKSMAVASVALLVAGLAFIIPQVRAADAAKEEPKMLDIERFYRVKFIAGKEGNPQFETVAGKPVIDGLPFDLRGNAWVYGQKEFDYNQGENDAASGKANPFPDFKGIVVGRKFEELHLLHSCRWADVEGRTIAFIRLNYDDGTAFEFPIGYGVHVRDWQRLPSEETETVTDPATKICWRDDTPTRLKGTMRMFKTTLTNPLPNKTVATLSIISARQVASYQIAAATVCNHDASRKVMPAVPSGEPERRFDGECVVSVLDDVTGEPLAGVLVDPGMSLDDVGVIASPRLTDEYGVAVVRYPKSRVKSLSIWTEKEGYQQNSTHLKDSIDDAIVLRLSKPPKLLPEQ